MKPLTIDEANTALCVAQSPRERLDAAEALIAAAQDIATRQRNAIAEAARIANGGGRSCSYTPYELKAVETARKGHQLFIGDELHTVTGKPICNPQRTVLALKRGGPATQAPSDVRLSFPAGTRLTFVAGVTLNGVWQG